MADLSNTELAERVRAHRAVAHRAVTEGVNLKYVEVLRRACYEVCDLADALLARLDDAKKGWTAAENARTRAEARLDAVTRQRDEARADANNVRLSLSMQVGLTVGTESLLADAEADRDRYKAALEKIAAGSMSATPGGFARAALRAAATEESHCDCPPSETGEAPIEPSRLCPVHGDQAATEEDA